MKDILKYLFFLVLGIIFYILLNGKDGFSVGVPEYLLTIDNGIISIGTTIYSDDPESWSVGERNKVIEINKNRYYVYGNDIDEARRIFDVYIASRQSDADGAIGDTGGIGDAGGIGGIGDAGGACAPIPWSLKFKKIPWSLKLSIQIHEFALFVHYQLRGNLNFTFYVQPRYYMSIALEETYGEPLTRMKIYEPEELENIRRISGGELPVVYNDGIKIPFEEILQRYNGIVPELYSFEKVGNSYKNKYGFQLLDKRENQDNIHAFYNVVREYFCNIPLFRENDYINDLKTEYAGQNWEEYESMAWRANFQISDVLKFLEYMINNEEEKEALRRLVQHYVNLYSTEIGDVRNCPVGVDLLQRDINGSYMIIKLKDSKSEFVYDNTEMVVHMCNFELDIPAQYHLGIMRNPSDLIDNKFNKKFSSDKYDTIVGLNTESRMF